MTKPDAEEKMLAHFAALDTLHAQYKKENAAATEALANLTRRVADHEHRSRQCLSAAHLAESEQSSLHSELTRLELEKASLLKALAQLRTKATRLERRYAMLTSSSEKLRQCREQETAKIKARADELVNGLSKRACFEPRLRRLQQQDREVKLEICSLRDTFDKLESQSRRLELREGERKVDLQEKTALLAKRRAELRREREITSSLAADLEERAQGSADADGLTKDFDEVMAKLRRQIKTEQKKHRAAKAKQRRLKRKQQDQMQQHERKRQSKSARRPRKRRQEGQCAANGSSEPRRQDFYFSSTSEDDSDFA